MKVRGGEFSTGKMGNFQPELTNLKWRLHTLCTIPGLPAGNCFGGLTALFGQ